MFTDTPLGSTPGPSNVLPRVHLRLDILANGFFMTRPDKSRTWSAGRLLSYRCDRDVFRKGRFGVPDPQEVVNWWSKGRDGRVLVGHPPTVITEVPVTPATTRPIPTHPDSRHTQDSQSFTGRKYVMVLWRVFGEEDDGPQNLCQDRRNTVTVRHTKTLPVGRCPPSRG